MEIHEEWVTADDDDMMRQITGSGYDRRKRYIRATDGHGHSGKMQLRVHPSQLGQIARWINTPGSGYRSAQDFIRCAIAHRLHDMHEFHGDGTMDAAAAHDLLMGKLGTAKQEREERIEMMQQLETEVREMIQVGQFEGAVEMMDELDALVQEWPAVQKKQAEGLLDRLQGQLTAAVRAGRRT